MSGFLFTSTSKWSFAKNSLHQNKIFRNIKNRLSICSLDKWTKKQMHFVKSWKCLYCRHFGEPTKKSSSDISHLIDYDCGYFLTPTRNHIHELIDHLVIVIFVDVANIWYCLIKKACSKANEIIYDFASMENCVLNLILFVIFMR